MPALPKLGETPWTEGWSEQQYRWFAACSYLMIAAYLAVLFFSVTNFFQFILQSTDSFHKSSPLVVFYVLVFCCLASDIFYSFELVANEVNFNPFVVVLPSTFKVALGVEQIWMMLELTMRVNQMIKTCYVERETFIEEQQDDVLSKKIKCGRISTLLFNMALISATLIHCLTSDWETMTLQVEAYVIGGMFILLFIGLLSTSIYLATRLRLQNRLLMMPHRGVKKEICFLVTTLTIFSASYIIRIIYDFTPEDQDLESEFKTYMVSQISGLPFDLIPICLIVVFHRRNLAQMERRMTADQLSSSAENCSAITGSTERLDDIDSTRMDPDHHDSFNIRSSTIPAVDQQTSGFVMRQRGLGHNMSQHLKHSGRDSLIQDGEEEVVFDTRSNSSSQVEDSLSGPLGHMVRNQLQNSSQFHYGLVSPILLDTTSAPNDSSFASTFC